MPFDKVEYDNEYIRQNYDIIRAVLPKGKGSVVKAAAKERGTSVSAMIVEALESYFGLDLGK